MGRDGFIIDGTNDEFYKARETALSLVENKPVDIDTMFDYQSLEMVEIGIKNLNEYSDKCWLLSSILLYSLVYDKQMYTQSGLMWEDYVADSKKRLGMERRDISESLSSARFFINHYDALVRAGWTPNGSSRKLARAELAYEVCGSYDDVIQHLVNDSWREFKDWYSSFKTLPPTQEVEDKRPDIVIKNHVITINNVKAVTISDDLPSEERIKLENYLEQIYNTIKRGDVPAIIPVYDEKEEKALLRLRDKNRQGK